MPVQNYLQGIAPIGQGLTNGLVMGEEMQQGRQRNALLDRDIGLRDRRLKIDESEATQANQTRQLGLLYEGVLAKDPQAIEAAIGVLGQISPMDPRAADMFRKNPDRLAPALARIAGIPAAPGPVTFGKTPSGGEYAMQEGKITGGIYHRPQFAPDRGNAPPSGYRWKKDGTLERIPGGPGDKQGGDEPFGASDTNAIRGLVTTVFGGVYDPVSGNVSGIKPEDARNLNRVAAVASALYRSNPGLSHAEAVDRALAEIQGGTPPPPAAAPPKNRPPLSSFQK